MTLSMYRFIGLLFFCTALLVGCGGGSDSGTNADTIGDTVTDSNDTDDDSTDDDSTDDDQTDIGGDITDAIFTNTNPLCNQYLGTYTSKVTDVIRNMEFSGETTITEGNGTCIITTREIPNHNFNDGNGFANDTSVQSGEYTVSQFPQQANTPTALSLSTSNAIFLNGVLVDLLAAACYDTGNEPIGREKIGCNGNGVNANHPWRYDPMSPLNQFGTDSHNAHTQPDGTYHYHGDPNAMYDAQCLASQTVSPVIGFAADGFPIYGPCFNDGDTVRVARSSYQLKAGARQAVDDFTTPEAGVGLIQSNNYDGQFIGDWEYSEGAGDLDACNGMTVNGNYGYYLTDQYPWVIGCFTGTPHSSFSKSGNRLQNRLHSHPHDH